MGAVAAAWEAQRRVEGSARRWASISVRLAAVWVVDRPVEAWRGAFKAPWMCDPAEPNGRAGAVARLMAG